MAGLPERCAYCDHPFPLNGRLAALRAGRRIAFDPGRHRVWRICPDCSQWNLLGEEASAAALPELQGQFDAGLQQSFDGLEVAVLGGEVELWRLGGRGLHDTPGIGMRDDVARHRRRRETESLPGLLAGLFWCAVVLWSVTIATKIVEVIVKGAGAEGRISCQELRSGRLSLD